MSAAKKELTLPSPHPWKFVEGAGRIEDKNGRSVCYMAGSSGISMSTVFINARLIAATPDLLAASKEAIMESTGLAAYLETCSPDVIIDNLPSLVAGLRMKQELFEAAMRKARGEK